MVETQDFHQLSWKESIYFIEFFIQPFLLYPHFFKRQLCMSSWLYIIFTHFLFFWIWNGDHEYICFSANISNILFFFFFTSASSFVVPFFFDYSILLSSRLNYWVRIEMSCGTAYVWGLNRIIWKTLQATWNWNLPRLVGMSLTDALMIKTIGTTNSHLTFYCCFLKNAPLVS